MKNTWSIKNSNFTSNFDNLLSLNTAELENRTSQLANVTQNLYTCVSDLKKIAAEVKTYLNDGTSPDAESYVNTLSGIIEHIQDIIIPTLKEYTNTMNTFSTSLQRVAKIKFQSYKNSGMSIVEK